MAKLTSFQRQLNLYGFRRVTKGEDQGAYFHPKFQYGQGNAVSEIRRLPGNSSSRAHHVHHSSLSRSGHASSSSSARRGSRHNLPARVDVNNNVPTAFPSNGSERYAADLSMDDSINSTSTYRPTHGHRTRGSVNNNYRNYKELENNFTVEDDLDRVPVGVHSASGVPNQANSNAPWDHPSVISNPNNSMLTQSSAVDNIRVSAPMYHHAIPVTSRMSNLSKRLGFGANMLRDTYNGGYNDFNLNRPYNFNSGYRNNQMNYQSDEFIRSGMKRAYYDDGTDNFPLGLPYKRQETDYQFQARGTNMPLTEIGKWESNANSAGFSTELNAAEKAPVEVNCADFDLGFFDFDDINTSAPASQGDPNCAQQYPQSVTDIKAETSVTESAHG